MCNSNRLQTWISGYHVPTITQLFHGKRNKAKRDFLKRCGFKVVTMHMEILRKFSGHLFRKNNILSLTIYSEWKQATLKVKYQQFATLRQLYKDWLQEVSWMIYIKLNSKAIFYISLNKFASSCVLSFACFGGNP